VKFKKTPDIFWYTIYMVTQIDQCR
jgi:hypothetical protein